MNIITACHFKNRKLKMAPMITASRRRRRQTFKNRAMDKKVKLTHPYTGNAKDDAPAYEYILHITVTYLKVSSHKLGPYRTCFQSNLIDGQIFYCPTRTVTLLFIVCLLKMLMHKIFLGIFFWLFFSLSLHWDLEK